MDCHNVTYFFLQETVRARNGVIEDTTAERITRLVSRKGRGWWTGHCAIVASDRLNGLELNIRQSADGRLLRGDYAINGAKRTLACVYARATGVTVPIMLDLQTKLPAHRHSVGL